jgi:excisionase family DNA binding protein
VESAKTVNSDLHDPIDPEHLFTSTEVGDLLQVNPSSVKKWVNAGFLSAFRTPGGHRRIRAADLITFLDQHHMPVPAPLRGAARRRLVVVDDDRTQLRALSRRLRRWADQIEVSVVDDALDALVRIGARRPHLVVLDVYLPGIDGLELCRHLRRSPDTQGATLVAVSGQMTPALEAAALEAGAHRALAKPIDLTTVLNEIGIAVESRR